MKILTETAITTEAGDYLGMVFSYEGGFTHSIQNHGTAKFETEQDARADFFATKAALPPSVHAAIFGAAA